MKRIAYFTNIAPHYRDRLWQILATNGDFELHFFFGKTSKFGIKEINFDSSIWVKYQNRIHCLRNCRIKGLLFWQIGVIREVIINKWDMFIFLGDMYIISTWISAIIARFRNKQVFFWSHGIYGNEQAFKLFFRKYFLLLANKHFLYGNYAKDQMVKAGFKESVLYVIFNSLNYDKHLVLRREVIDNKFYHSNHFFKNPDLPVLIFIGRITPVKKLELLIQTVKELYAELYYVNLIVIGEGPMLSFVTNLSLELNNSIYFYGPCYEEKVIGKLLANASLCVSPGNVGLTAIHSLSFGTPVITHNNFSNQMPEFEAIEDGVTGAFFKENSIESLKRTIIKWLSEHPCKNDDLTNNCYNRIDDYYNPYYQLQIVNLAILNGDTKSMKRV